MRRTALFCSLLLPALVAGCRTTVTISSRPDPERFQPFDFVGTSGRYFGELVFDSPEEVREEEYEIESADIYAVVYAETLVAVGPYELEVDLYLGIESGDHDLDDPDRTEYLTTVVISGQGVRHPIEAHDPRLIEAAVRREHFYLKGIVRLESASAMAGRVRIDDVYFIAVLERDTSGLLPFLYFF